MSELDPWDTQRQQRESDPYNRIIERAHTMHRIIQTIIEGTPDWHVSHFEDDVWWELHEIQEENGLPEGITADDCFNLFRSNYLREQDK